MGNHKKRVLAPVLALAFAVLAAGCGRWGGHIPRQETTKTDSADEEGADEDGRGPKAGGGGPEGGNGAGGGERPEGGDGARGGNGAGGDAGPEGGDGARDGAGDAGPEGGSDAGTGGRRPGAARPGTGDTGPDKRAAKASGRNPGTGRAGAQGDKAGTGTGAAGLTPLPRRYDSREDGRAAPVRDQGDLGTCWAFASLSALESRLLPKERWDFSEDHMSHDPDFLLGQTGGGEYTMAMAYLLSGQGPVTEGQDPYGDGISPQGLEPVKAVQEIRILPEGDREAIKRAVLQWGGVQSSLYTSMQNGKSVSGYYQPETFAYCYPWATPPNHDVVIVGWDDDFPKEAFSVNVKEDGAFLCENSWGTGFGDGGFFYVSYEDGNLGKNNVVYSGVYDVDCYDILYQSDRCGWIGQLGYGGPSAWAANVYTAHTKELLTSVGFYATGQETDYEVYVVRDVPRRPGDDVFAERRKLAEGHLEYAGFYTINLDEAVELQGGERFCVMVRLTTPGAVHPVAIEYDAGDRKCRIDLGDGEGYVSAEGLRWERVEDNQNCNLCLKAYTLIR